MAVSLQYKMELSRPEDVADIATIRARLGKASFDRLDPS
jgi:hypothetical protein